MSHLLAQGDAARLPLADQSVGLRRTEQRIARQRAARLYTVRTWDVELQRFTPQEGLTVPSCRVLWRGLLKALRQLRGMGYPCDRTRDRDGGHSNSDPSVLVERVK